MIETINSIEASCACMMHMIIGACIVSILEHGSFMIPTLSKLFAWLFSWHNLLANTMFSWSHGPKSLICLNHHWRRCIKMIVSITHLELGRQWKVTIFYTFNIKRRVRIFNTKNLYGNDTWKLHT